MIDPLYQTEILRLAAEAAKAGRLAAPDATATVRNPLCGDQITVDLDVADGRITDYAHHTRACVLCQASASLLGGTALGRDGSQCDDARARLQRFLTGDPAALGPDLAAFAVFAPVVDYVSRHTCILLPFDALNRAMADFTATAQKTT